MHVRPDFFPGKEEESESIFFKNSGCHLALRSLVFRIKARDSVHHPRLGMRQGNMACTTGDTRRGMLMLS